MAQQSSVKLFEKKLKHIVSDLPVFSLPGSQVDVLSEPVQFYQSLLSGCDGACRRIILSSLYLGDGPLCHKLVATLSARMAECPSLRVHFLLDANRASRTSVVTTSNTSTPQPLSLSAPSPPQQTTSTALAAEASSGRRQSSGMGENSADRSLSAGAGFEPSSADFAVSTESTGQQTGADRDVTSSCHTLARLMQRFPQQCTVSLYHTPNHRRVLRRLLPQRANEVLGVQHMKLYVFDDDVVISGANLSEDYFTHRQDRCVRVRNYPALAQFCCDLVHTVSNMSLSMGPQRELKTPVSCPVHPYLGKYEAYVSVLKQRVDLLFDRWHAQTGSDLTSLASDCPQSDTVIVPTVNLGLASIDLDSRLLEAVLSTMGSSLAAAAPCRLFLATGYFNITDSLRSSILKQSGLTTSLICAHPSANGFMNSSGMSGYIPAMYTYLLHCFYDNTDGQRQNVSILEYQRPGWTFHGKGFWWYSSGCTLPSMTSVGSSNYGYRSAYRDLEAQLLIYTRNETLKRHLDDERRNLYLHSSPVDDTTFLQPDRQVPYWLKMVTRLIRTVF